MEHIRSSVTIYQTYNYDIFEKMDGNRMLHKNKIGKIISVIDSGMNILKYAPIIVNESMEVIDGQHRLEVCKRMKSQVYYVIIEGQDVGIKEVAQINSNTSNWTAQNYLQSYCKLQLKDYLDLREFLGTYKFTIGVGAVLMSSGVFRKGGDGTMVIFKEGLFKVNEYETAYDIGEKCALFESVVQSPYMRGFGHAVLVMIEADKVNWEKLISKMKAAYSLHKYIPSNRYKDNLNDLEQIYNKGNNKRHPIY